MKKFFLILVIVAVATISIISLVKSEEIQYSEQLDGITLTVDYSELNVRSEPSTKKGEDSVVETLKSGTEVVLTGNFVEGSASDPKNPTTHGWVETTKGWVVRSGLEW